MLDPVRSMVETLSKDDAPAAHLLILCGTIPCCETSLGSHKLKQLSANLGHAAVRNPQTARSAE
jgi:hypothetical protein